jgi:hypothetical protein
MGTLCAGGPCLSRACDPFSGPVLGLHARRTRVLGLCARARAGGAGRRAPREYACRARGREYGNRRRARPDPGPALAGPRGRPHGGRAALSVRGRTRPHATNGARCVRSARVGRCVCARASVPERRAGSRLLLSLSHAPCVVRARGGGGAPGRRRRPSCAGVCRRPGRAGRGGEARGCGENEVCCDLAPSEFPKHSSPPIPPPPCPSPRSPQRAAPSTCARADRAQKDLRASVAPRTEERGAVPPPASPPAQRASPPSRPRPCSPGCKLRGLALTRVLAGSPRRAAVQRPGHPHRPVPGAREGEQRGAPSSPLHHRPPPATPAGATCPPLSRSKGRAGSASLSSPGRTGWRAGAWGARTSRGGRRRGGSRSRGGRCRGGTSPTARARPR